MNKEIIVDLINQGLSTHQIGNKLGKSQGSVAYWLKKYNLKTKHKKVGQDGFDYEAYFKLKVSNRTSKTEENKEFWISFQKYIDEGHNWKECCSKFNISIATMGKARKLGYIKTNSFFDSIQRFYKSETKEHKKDRIKNIKAGVEASKKDFGGYRHGAGRGKKFRVIDSFGQPVMLQSSFEYKLFQILIENNIKWIRPSFLRYGNKKYFPDFYLIDYKVYIDTKNDYLIKIDKEKIEAVEKQNNLKIHILSEKQITKNFINKIINGSVM